MNRRCLSCRALIRHGSRCPRCEIQRPRGRRLMALRQAFVIGRPCAHCGRPAEHLDHIVPLWRGGGDQPSNWQPLCAACNLAKGDS